jgi:hypothetical protein
MNILGDCAIYHFPLNKSVISFLLVPESGSVPEKPAITGATQSHEKLGLYGFLATLF